MLSWLAHFIERHPFLHRSSLAVWKHFPPRLAGFLRKLLTTRWTAAAVAVMIDEEANPPEVLLVQHSYRTKGAWGLPGGSLESDLRNPWEPSGEESRDDVIEASEVFEELGQPAFAESKTDFAGPGEPLKEYERYSSDARILFPLLT